MTMFPLVSCLIINWNGFEFTKKCINSLLKTKYPHIEIILLDNGSDKNEYQKLKRLFGKKVRIIKNLNNEGYAIGMNKAVKFASGKYIMLLNNDMEFDPFWLNSLVERLQKNPKIGACQPKIRDMKRKNSFEYAAAAGGFLDILGYPFARGRIFSSVEKDKGQYENNILVAWAGIFLTRKKIIDTLGLFDPIYVNYAEDVDFSIRLYNAGYTIVYEPKSVVYHYGGGVLGKNLEKKMFFLHRNHMILVVKNWSLPLLAFLLVPRILMDVASLIYYLKTGYSQAAMGLIKAYISLFPKIPQIIKARIRTKKKLSLATPIPLYKGSVAWEYFIRGRKTYTQIVQHANTTSLISRIVVEKV